MLGSMNITSASRSTSRRRRVATTAASFAVVGALLGVAACSSDDGDAAVVPVVSETTAPPPTVPPPTPPPSPTEPPPTVASTTAEPPTTPPPPATTVDPARQAQLEAILAQHQAAGEFVGARVALAEADGTVSEASFGSPTVDPASGPIDPAVPWNIGSATKAFVAVVVLQLAEEGRIDLDGPVDRYAPYLAGGERITARQLLGHTSGLGEYGDQPAVLADPLRQWTPAELVAVADAAGRVGEPGGPHRYSNTNYVVLGDVIEAVTGHPWADEVQARIAEPLGMSQTGVGVAPYPPGFIVGDGSFVDATNSFDPSVGGAAGELFSTSRDLRKFAAALANGTLLDPESKAAMETFVPAEDLSQFGVDHGYGLGIERYITNGMTIIGHMGTGEIGSSYVGYDADTRATVAVTTNTAISGPAALIAVEALATLRTAS